MSTQTNTPTHKARYGLLTVMIISIMVIFNLSLLVLTATAHGPEILAESSPTDGEQLAESPQQITMVFTAELYAKPPITAPHILEVYNLDGDRVDLEDTHLDATEAERQIMTVSLPTLEEGVYMVRWSVSPTDGDIVNGLHFFSVGDIPDDTRGQLSNSNNTASSTSAEPPTNDQTSASVFDASQGWPWS